MDKIITIPFGYLLDFLNQLTNNYGVALILFAILVRVVLLPVNAKSKKSMMKMSRMQPKIQEIQRKYANDRQKQDEAIRQLQAEEGASMGCSGCLWSLVPMLILIPLYQVVRQPIQFMLHESAEVAGAIVEAMRASVPGAFTGSDFYEQLAAAANISQYKDAVQAFLQEKGLTLANPETLNGLNFSFLNIDLGQIPTFNIFSKEWVWDWNHIGAFLIPVMSAGSQVLNMWVSQKTNDSVITNKDGIQDKETAANSQAAQQSKMMMWMMPLMSLWIGFTVPAALSLYWFVGGVFMMVEGVIMTKHYRKVYDAEDAVRLQRAMERDAIEAEKERIRAEKRAANPDGITENTSKKKLQKKLQAEEAAAKAAAAKEYAAKRGIVEEENPEETVMSGIPERPWCKGRAYDPNRYNANHTEE